MTTDDPYAPPVTTQPPDPSGLDLSDAANAALYPDVEHPDPEQLPPEAFQVPPPIEQRESPLLDIVRAYATGQADWPTTKQALIDFPYEQNPPVEGSPVSTSGTQGQWWADVEANAGTFAADNTWGQLQEAKAAGMITRAEFNEVLAAKASRGQQADAEAAAKGDPQPGEGKDAGFDPAKHPRGVHGRWAHISLSQADVADPVKLPRSKRVTALIPNGTRVQHEDGRIGKVRHVTTSSLRPGHDLINPVTGKAVGKVKDVRWGPDFTLPVDDRTPLGADRHVELESGESGVHGMGGQRTIFEPEDPEMTAAIEEHKRQGEFRLSEASPNAIASAIATGKVKIHSDGGDRVTVSHGTTELSYDRVPSGPQKGHWHGAYVTEYGNTRGEHPHGDVTPTTLAVFLERARDQARPSQFTEDMRKHAHEVAVQLLNNHVDYDTAEGHFLDMHEDLGESDRAKLMAVLDDVYGK